MRIAVVGSGIAALTAAYYLRDQHEIEIFEKNDYAGGHSNTVTYREGDRELDLDTGFLVHNPKNYPNLIRLFEVLGVETQESEMSFSCRCHRCDIEYRGSDLQTMFAHRPNLLKPSVYRMVYDIFRFFREAPGVLAEPQWNDKTLGEWVAAKRFSRGFRDHFLLPFCAAIWSAPSGEAAKLPARFTIQFFENHHLLARYGAPLWRSMTGGSRRYVAAITREFPGRVHLERPVRAITREEGGVRLRDAAGREERFDQVVIGAHADEALALLADPSDDEREILGKFGYTPNTTLLHYDDDALPRQAVCRAAWNYEIEDCRAVEPHVSVTYSLNRLQTLPTEREYCVTLNRARPVDADKVIREIHYTHPRFDLAAFEAQAQLPRINGQRRTWFCGSYFGYGFHEDAHVSGLAVARKLGYADPHGSS